MKTLNIILSFIITFILVSCNETNTKITNPKDYNSYLELKSNKNLNFINQELTFWQKKYDDAPNQKSYLIKIASNYNSLFDITANIDYLYKTEQLLKEHNEALNYKNSNSIRSLARNYIKQHRFKEALVLANRAKLLGDGMLETNKLLFDIQMELGNYGEAEKNLNSLAINNKDFDFLIRNSKWHDYKGDLKTTISQLKKASEQAELNENDGLKIWSYSNLADVYGHAGMIKESYEYYLKTLKIEPNYSYALKGIAWIIFSHERNTKEANRIIDIISKNHNSPDFYLLKSEIAEYEGNQQLKNNYLSEYFSMLNKKDYGAMYNKYNASIYSENKNDLNKAFAIANQEIANRPTPDSYDLLAWAYYKKGDYKNALQIANKYVANKTFEPNANYHLALIYKANKMNDKIAPLKEELISSEYELGPNVEKEINNL